MRGVVRQKRRRPNDAGRPEAAAVPEED